MKVVHETVIKDIVDIFNDIKSSKITDLIQNARKNGKRGIRSIAQSSSNFTLVYPCLVSDSLDIGSVSMVSKANERKNAQMIQLLLGAYQQEKLNSGEEFDPIRYLQQFHKNLNISYTSTDDVLDTVTDIVNLVKESETGVKVRTSECILTEAQQIKYLEEHSTKDNELPDMFSESSIATYKVDNSRYGKIDVFQERTNYSRGLGYHDDEYFPSAADTGNVHARPTKNVTVTGTDVFGNKIQYDQEVPMQSDDELVRFSKLKSDALSSIDRRTYDKEKHGMDKEKHEMDKEKHNWDRNRELREIERQNRENRSSNIKNLNTAQQTSQGRLAQLQNVDVKKANELVGTPIMVTVHICNDQGLLDPVSFLIAIKSKIYPLNSKDIIQRIINKNRDRNFFGKLVKVATGEISFVRDFLFAIDNAKMDAKSQSNKGNSSKLWRVLERMSRRSKLSRALGKQNEYMAITTLVISQEEVEYIKRYANMNMENENIAKGIIDAYNLLSLVIVDETNETCKFLYNEDQALFEELSFNQLEREATDGSYKKMVNLITKMK